MLPSGSPALSSGFPILFSGSLVLLFVLLTRFAKAELPVELLLESGLNDFLGLAHKLLLFCGQMVLLLVCLSTYGRQMLLLLINFRSYVCKLFQDLHEWNSC